MVSQWSYWISCSLQSPQQGMLEGDFALCISLYHGYELLMQMGLRSLFFYIQGIMDGSRGRSPYLLTLHFTHRKRLFWTPFRTPDCPSVPLGVCAFNNVSFLCMICKTHVLCLFQRCPGPGMSCRGLPPSWTFTTRWKQCLWSHLLVPEHSFIPHQSHFLWLSYVVGWGILMGSS